jgi:hypothetical protein
MSSFAQMIGSNEAGQDNRESNNFVQLEVYYKILPKPADFTSSDHCPVAKLDSASSLH